jgi:hypothetical protein
MSKMNQKIGVFQYFYHCKGETLPVRDVLKRHKTEPHYENLTENWCGTCMNNRIISANRRGVDYLFLMTKFDKENHPSNGKLLVVGFLYRAKEKIWRKLSRKIPSGVNGFESRDVCGFFAGDKQKSHFVSAENAYPLGENIKNARWKWFADTDEANRIIKHLKKSPNILQKLQKRVAELKSQIDENKKCKECP